MSFDTAPVRSLILAAITAVALALAVNVGYGLIFLWLWRAPLAEMLSRCRAGAPYFVLGLFLMAVGAILGARLAADRAGRDSRLSGLAVGAGLALIVVIVALAQGHLDFWLPPNVSLAAFGGWLGSRFAKI